MTFIYKYYRRNFDSTNQLEQVIAPIKNKNESSDKIERTLNTIYSGSKIFNCLQYKDTPSIYDVLKQNDVEFQPLFYNFEQVGKNNENNDKMEVDADNEDNEQESTRADTMSANPNGVVNMFIPLNKIRKKPKVLVSAVTGISGDILEYKALVENILSKAVTSIIDNVTIYNKKDNNEISLSPAFQWSYMGVKKNSLDTQTVYIAFEDIMIMFLFKTIIESITIDKEHKMMLIAPTELEEKIVPMLNELFDINLEKSENIIIEVSTHISEIQQIAHNEILKSTPKDDYLTRCKRLSENYRIDPRDLSDVPSDMLDIVKQNIIDFRLHVLTDLENKQKERMLQDKLNVQKELSQDYNSSNNSICAYELEEQQEKTYSNMSDIEYESMLQSNEKKSLDKHYYYKLGQYKKREENRLKQYANFEMVTKHESYLKNVIPRNRRKFLANFVFNVTDIKNKIDMNFDYYTKHTNYLQYREKIKLAEKEKDKHDEMEELKGAIDVSKEPIKMPKQSIEKARE
ncbi:U1 snRNP component [Pichia californica]|nr:U1 snRNP component [[Candida] californica]